VLSIIKGSAQIIETNLEDREKIQTRVNRIKTVVEQGSGIVKAMLGFSRGSDKEFAFCDINAAVDETIKLLGDRFLKGIDIQFQRAPDLPLAFISKEFVQQILLNFIFNAAESLAGPGKVVLRTAELSTFSGYVALQASAAPQYLIVCVQDFGCGISPEIMPRIFEPFFTTKAFSARRGTGLGLSMVYQLAKEMGCGLMVESQVGGGSTFSLVIPVIDKSGPELNKR
jgi:signal transduction histidine kinase